MIQTVAHGLRRARRSPRRRRAWVETSTKASRPCHGNRGRSPRRRRAWVETSRCRSNLLDTPLIALRVGGGRGLETRASPRTIRRSSGSCRSPRRRRAWVEAAPSTYGRARGERAPGVALRVGGGRGVETLEHRRRGSPLAAHPSASPRRRRAWVETRNCDRRATDAPVEARVALRVGGGRGLKLV